MNGAIFLFSQYAFMAWCSVKAQGQLYSPFDRPSRASLLAVVVSMATFSAYSLEWIPSLTLVWLIIYYNNAGYFYTPRL
jgi:hypothetical protein